MSNNKSMTITEFLEERIAQDERDAHKLAETDMRPVLSLATTINHPQRLLAEVAAKRAFLERIHKTGWTVGNIPFGLIVAAIYADHPDYQQEWAK